MCNISLCLHCFNWCQAGILCFNWYQAQLSVVGGVLLNLSTWSCFSLNWFFRPFVIQFHPFTPSPMDCNWISKDYHFLTFIIGPLHDVMMHHNRWDHIFNFHSIQSHWEFPKRKLAFIVNSDSSWHFLRVQVTCKDFLKADWKWSGWNQELNPTRF